MRRFCLLVVHLLDFIVYFQYTLINSKIVNWNMSNDELNFDFVISYAGEDSDYAQALYKLLFERQAEVFFAPEYQAELWGENLYEYLADIYSKQGTFCIPLVSEHYVKKQWTRHEWKSAQERALGHIDSAYILPIRIDDTPLPGLLENISYLNASSYSIEEIAGLALEKLALKRSDLRRSKLGNEFDNLRNQVRQLRSSNLLRNFDDD
jgi:hypothetical protein